MLMCLPLIAIGCASKGRGGPNPALSQRLLRQAMQPKNTEQQAIDLYRKAVAADPFNSAAHNDLGIALMKQSKYYEAAQEFDRATKLRPSSPEPRVNLGVLYEQVWRLHSAQAQYEQALVVSPDYLPALQAAARVRVRLDENDAKTAELLRSVALRSTDPVWRQWAQRELLRFGEVPATQAAPGILNEVK